MLVSQRSVLAHLWHCMWLMQLQRGRPWLQAAPSAAHQRQLVGDWPRESSMNFLKNNKHWGQQAKLESPQRVLECHQSYLFSKLFSRFHHEKVDASWVSEIHPSDLLPATSSGRCWGVFSPKNWWWQCALGTCGTDTTAWCAGLTTGWQDDHCQICSLSDTEFPNFVPLWGAYLLADV